MGVQVTEEREQQAVTSNEANGTQQRRGRALGALTQLRQYVRDGFPQLRWGLVLLLGVASGLLMPLSIIQPGVLSFFAGIIPVGAGLIIGRRVPGFYGLHGFMTGVVAAVVSLIVINGLLYLTPLGLALQEAALARGTPPEQATLGAFAVQFSSFVPFSLLTFCTFGAIMSGRTEARNRAVRAQVAERGGRLEKAATVRSVEDIRGMSLPQFGSYVNNLFKKQGFTFKDYRFVDKDKHLDMWLEYEGELWHLRLSVQDKVNPGTVEGLLQEMKREGTRKGVVVASTEFTPSAQKSAKGRPVVLIDGQTLYQIAE